MSERELDDWTAIAEEHGGRVAFYHDSRLGDVDALELMVLRVVDADDGFIAFVLNSHEREAFRLLIRREDLEWALANPVSDDEDEPR